MKKILLLVGLSMIAFACSKDGKDYETRTSFYGNTRLGEQADSMLVCVTWNIQCGFDVEHDPWNRNQTGGTPEQIDALKEVLKRVNPDIVCLQEVPLNRYNTVVKDFIRALAGAMNMNYAFGAHGYNDPYGIEPVEGQWGNAILSRFEILEMENRENEYHSTWERRSILRVKLRLDANSRLEVYSLHYVPSDQSVPNSLPFFMERSDVTQLIMGDFNMVWVPQLDDAGYTDVLWADTLLRYSIDRIYTTTGPFTISATGFIPGSSGVSDHEPVFCRLKRND